MKIILLFILIIFNSCNSYHPNLDEKEIVWDEEAKKMLENITSKKQPEIIIEGIEPKDPIFKSEEFVKLKSSLIDTLKARNLLFFDNILFYVYTSNNTILELVLSEYAYSGIEFKTNKNIRNKDDLMLAAQCFSFSRLISLRDKIWTFNNGKTVYTNTIYTQFKFLDIKDLKITNKHSLSELLNKI